MTTKHKIVSLPALKRALKNVRQRKTVAFTNGCFDILHYGHIRYLEKAKGAGRILVVGMNSDKSVRRIKGPQRPIVSQKERAAVLAALACVDFVTVFDDDTPLELISEIMPDILIKGADWNKKDVVGGDLVRSHGGKVELIKYLPRHSTTDIIKTISRKCAKLARKNSFVS